MDNLAIYFIIFASICKGTWSINLDYETLKKAGVESRIGGGEETTIEKRPYMAYLEVIYEDALNQPCSGAIVTKHHIVTSAVCVYNADSIDVRVGSTDRTTGGQRFTSNVFMEHPMYLTGEFDYDVGVVVIKDGIMLDGSTVDTIEVAKLYQEPEIGDIVTISGWGQVGPEGSRYAYSSNLKEADFVIVHNKECQDQPGLNPIVTDRHLCAIDEDEAATVCEGDQGDPVVNESGSLVGVVAMFPGCDPAQPFTVVNFSQPEIRSFIMTMTTE